MSNSRQKNKSLSEGLKNMRPEDWARFRKAQMDGEISLIKNGPWYYKFILIIFALIVILFLVLFVNKAQEAY